MLFSLLKCLRQFLRPKFCGFAHCREVEFGFLHGAWDLGRDSLSQRVAALAIHPVLHTTDTAAHAFDTRNHCKVLLLEPPRHSVARGSLGNSQESGDLRYREPALFADFRTHHGRLQKSTALP